MKTVGIIGGLGPETTAKFYLEVVFGCYEKDKTSRPPILILNVPQPCDVENEVIAESKGVERYIPLLIDAAKKLEAAGADFLVMPCNSLHVYIKNIRKAVTIPVLSIIEESVRFLQKRNIKRVGVIATEIAINGNLYAKEFEKIGITQVLPNPVYQGVMGKMIRNVVFNSQTDKDRNLLRKLIDDLKTQDVEHVILACTDLQLIVPKYPSLSVHDTMSIFAKATVDEILRLEHSQQDDGKLGTE